MRIRRRATIVVLVSGLLLIGALVTALAVGGPKPPIALASISEPFKAVDFSDLPPVLTFRATDGQYLGYRAYAPQAGGRGSVTLVHGSSGSSISMHPLAKALSTAGYRVFALDIRGHGQSGSKGHIDYIGQLEQDLADFVQAVQPPRPAMLAGFSSGGGFVLRFSGSERQSIFESYLLLAPFISQDAANQRPDSGGWSSVGLPRLIGLVVLNGIGIRGLNHLPVVAFAVDDRGRTLLTPEYDFNLTMNFRPHHDYCANIGRVNRPTAIVAGTADELFRSDRLAEIVESGGKNWPIDLIEGTGHIQLTLDPAPIWVIVQRVRRLQDES